MADTLTDTLTGSVRTSLTWARVDSQEVGWITNRRDGRRHRNLPRGE